MSADDDYQLAVHEAGHAVVAHLVGIEIDHVTIKAKGGSGYSRPVRNPTAAIADKLWAEATAIRRKLMLVEYRGGKWDGRKWVGGRDIYVLRKGARRKLVRVRGFSKPLPIGKLQATPAPQELVDRMERLRKRARTIWKKATAKETRADHVKDLMHTLGGPVADSVFFNVPFEAPRWRWSTKEEVEAAKAQSAGFGCAITWSGNAGAGSDFRSIRERLKHIDNANWKEAREFYRHKVEQLVRQHRTTIQRVAKALLRRGTLNGAELAKLIK
jgi:hypothetical protein